MIKLRFSKSPNKYEKSYISRCPSYIRSLYEGQDLKDVIYELRLFEYWRSSDVVSNWASILSKTINNHILSKGPSGKFKVKLEIENQVFIDFPIEITQVYSTTDSDIVFIESNDNYPNFGHLKIYCNLYRWYTHRALLNILNHEMMHAFQTCMIRRARLFNVEHGKDTRFFLEPDSIAYNRFVRLVHIHKENEVIQSLWNVYHATLKSELAASIQELDSELTQDPNLILDDTRTFRDFIVYPLKDLSFLKGFFLVDFNFPDPSGSCYILAKDKLDAYPVIEEALSLFNVKSKDYKEFLESLECKIKENEAGFREQFKMKRFLEHASEDQIR